MHIRHHIEQPPIFCAEPIRNPRCITNWTCRPRTRVYPLRHTVHFILLLLFTSCSTKFQLPEAPERMTEIPTFEDFPIPHYKIYKEKPRPVNLVSHPRAIRFKDRLIAGAKIGPNFAGDQTILRWLCGEECQQLAVVDARSGNVIFAPFVTHLGFRFRLDSKLLIVNPPEAVERASISGKSKSHYRTAYYVWHWGELAEVYAIRN